MSENFVIEAKPLTAAGFAPYGSVLSVDLTQEPTRSGQGWSTWNLLSGLPCDGTLLFGYVQTQERTIDVLEMERHVATFEVIYPHDAPLVQPVALPRDLDDPYEKPLAKRVEAFIIEPGQALVMSNGTWHSPAYPLRESTSYTFVVRENEESVAPVWVPFEGAENVRVRTEL